MRKFSWPFSALTKSLTLTRALLFAALLLLAAACGDDATETETGGATDGNAEDNAMDDNAMDDDAMDDMDHDGEHGHSGPVEVPDGMAVPVVSLSAEADSKSGHNLSIDLEDFTIAPESASTDPVDGEGHLHLYVDGERLMRFYNTEIYLSGLEPGEHQVMVELSANNHSAYAVDGDPIQAMTSITVEGGADAGHSHDGGELFESANPPEISLEISEDPKSGHNLFIDISNFDFAPENVGGDPVDGEGHVHLWIDGKKVGRLYGPWTHLALDPGTHEIMVEVSGNNHVTYGSGGDPILAMATIEVAEGDDHSMEDMEDGDSMSEEESSHAHSGAGQTLDIAAADADVVISGSLAGGELDIADRRFAIAEGQSVGVTFTSDEADEIHIHGYDILTAIGPGISTDIAFLADSAGTFEVEIEGSGRFLFEIQVS